MDEKAKATIETVRALTRPVLLFFLLLGSFFFIVEGVEGVWVNAWHTLTVTGVGEWIVIERPLGKIFNKISITRRENQQ